MKVRQESKNDFHKVFEVHKQAFRQDNESQLVEKIRIGKCFIPQLSLVDEIVGHILFSKIKIVGNTEHDSLSLAPMAILPRFQKQGIEGKLIITGLEIAKSLRFKSVIVLVHENYYPKFGFKKASKWNIYYPFEVPDEAFMAIELVENTLVNTPGRVKYPKEFNM